MSDASGMRHALRGYDIIEEEEARLPLSIREVFFNFSVYESIKVIGGVPIFLADHIERLLESARRLELAHPYKEQLLTEAIGELIRQDHLVDTSLRVQLVGGDHPYLYVFSQNLPTYPESYYHKGVGVISYHGERVEPEVKSNALLLNYLAIRRARSEGAFEAVFIDHHGMAVEGTRSNVFGIRGDTLFTPGTGVLSGVTRKYILQVAREMGMVISYSHTSLHEVLSGFFDEYFISSTSMGALPVRSFDKRVIGTDFPKTRALHTAVRSIENLYRETYC